MTEETWNAGRENRGVDGYGWIDLSDEGDERFDFLRDEYQGNAVLYDDMAYRLTGQGFSAGKSHMTIHPRGNPGRK